MGELTAKDIIAEMPQHFNPAHADGINADVQLHLTGNEGGDWVVKLRSGQCSVAPGSVANPRVNLSAEAQDFVGVVTGRMNPMMAYMTGKLRVQGDMALAARFASMFGGS